MFHLIRYRWPIVSQRISVPGIAVEDDVHTFGDHQVPKECHSAVMVISHTFQAKDLFCRYPELLVPRTFRPVACHQNDPEPITRQAGYDPQVKDLRSAKAEGRYQVQDGDFRS